MPEHPDLDKLVTPDPDDGGAEQKPGRRGKVRTKPSLRDRWELRRAHGKAIK